MNCLLCGNPAELKFKNHTGYQTSTHYDIHHCSHCNTAFPMPHQVDEEIYNHIYRQPDKIPGYDRYLTYADMVLKVRNPLNYLAKSEDVYWAIKTFLSKKNKKNLKVLEIGCGFGYLTYALAKSGYTIKGVDISQHAIDQAKQRYGDHYVCCNVNDMEGQYDVLILTEVVEHIPDIKEFFGALYNLLKPGGEIVLTTPNKSFYPKDILWESEAPPVHLWWFSEESMIHLARHFKCSLEFIDFKKRHDLDNHYPHLSNQIFEEPAFNSIKNFTPSPWPKLDADGKALPPRTITLTGFREVLNRLGLLLPLYKIKRKIWKKTFKRKQFSKLLDYGWPTMCAIFRKGTSRT